MSSKRMSIKIIAAAMIMAFGVTILPIVPVSAALIDNDRVAEIQTVEGERAFVNEFMNRVDVRKQFEAFGVNSDEAELRVAALSDAEVAQLAEQIKTSPAGQGAIGGIIGAVVLIFIVLLITDLLGFTSVFGFTNKGSANPS
ncbi:MAG: PA2779 family protein [Rhodospirillales bacterium]